MEVLDNRGVQVRDLLAWEPTVKGRTVALSGVLSRRGFSQLSSLIELPSLTLGVAEEESENNEAEPQAKTSLRYFKAVSGLAEDLRQQGRNDPNLRQIGVWMQTYARWIERLPILGVDPELLDYSELVADKLRQGSALVLEQQLAATAKMQNIRPASRGRAYRERRHVRRGRSIAHEQRRLTGNQRRQVATEARTTGAAEAIKIMNEIRDATVAVRRKMTERYNEEF